MQNRVSRTLTPAPTLRTGLRRNGERGNEGGVTTRLASWQGLLRGGRGMAATTILPPAPVTLESDATPVRKIDVFNHIYPRPYFDGMMAVAPGSRTSASGCGTSPCWSTSTSDSASWIAGAEYQQVLSIATAPIEACAAGQDAVDQARRANDMAELVSKHPHRFPGLRRLAAARRQRGGALEMERAVDTLGARGIQLFSNINGKPLDRPEFLALFDRMAAYDLPVWLHPYRGAEISDYATEARSQFEIWWTFGWPYETSVAMARLVFSGIDRHPTLKIITISAPWRIEAGWDQLARASDQDTRRC